MNPGNRAKCANNTQHLFAFDFLLFFCTLIFCIILRNKPRATCINERILFCNIFCKYLRFWNKHVEFSNMARPTIRKICSGRTLFCSYGKPRQGLMTDWKTEYTSKRYMFRNDLYSMYFTIKFYNVPYYKMLRLMSNFRYDHF